MKIEILLVNTAEKKRRLWNTIQDNYLVEWYLRFKFGTIEGGTSKTLKQNDLYAMAGFASIYLLNYQEPKDGVETGVKKTDTIHSLEQQRTMRKYASFCLRIVFGLLLSITPYEKVVLKIK